MRISAENVLHGTITDITAGAVDGLVKLDVNGQTITSNISAQAIRDLGLKVGTPAIAIIKASNVMMTLEKHYVISARNQLTGTIVSIEKGPVNALVTIDSDGLSVVSSATWQSIQEMGLKPGTEVTAVIKAASVVIAVEP